MYNEYCPHWLSLYLTDANVCGQNEMPPLNTPTEDLIITQVSLELTPN